MPFISLIGCSTEQKEKNPQQLALLGVHFIIVSLWYNTPVYNFINDRLVDESAVLRPLSWHLILYVFRYFSRKWQKISVYGFPDLIQNETPVHFMYGI